MRPELITITPDQAGALLASDQTNANRKFDKHNYLRFCTLIKSGLWKATHQGIAISPEGRIIDGQHRLTAIRDSGTPVPVMITWDVDPSVFDSIDIGKGRSGADLWSLGGHGANNVAAVARLVWLYGNMFDKPDWSNGPREYGLTQSAVFNWAVENGYAESIHRAATLEQRIRKEIKGIGAPAGASIAISHIYGGIPSDWTYSMVWEPLMKCVGLEEGMPVHTLHRIISRANHRDAKSSGNPFCASMANKNLIARTRLGILLRVVADVALGNRRMIYPFTIGGPLPDMQSIATEIQEAVKCS